MKDVNVKCFKSSPWTELIIFTLLLICALINVYHWNIGKTTNLIQHDLREMTPLNCYDHTYSNRSGTRAIILNTLKNLPDNQQVLFRQVIEDEQTKEVHIEMIYNSDELKDLFDAEGITDIKTFNQFLGTVDFEAAPVCFSPTDLFKSHKGNCYAFTLLTMYFLERYYPNVDYRVIPEKYEDGTSHVYLKIQKSDGEDICDLTKYKQLDI